MNVKFTAIAAIGLVSLLGAAQASATTIDFSGHSGLVGSTYTSEGVVFTGDATFGTCGGGCPPTTNSFAYGSDFTATFATTQSDVTFQSVSFSSTLATAYDAMGNVIATVTDDQGFPITDQIDTLAGAGIKYITFVTNGGYNGPAITNLTFDGTSVPEPATWALMLIGVGGLGAAARSRRKALVA